MIDTTDLVRRLRFSTNGSDYWSLCREAADAIEWLSAPAEPVLWMDKRWLDDETHTMDSFTPGKVDAEGWIPLYAHPAAPDPAYDYEVDRSQIEEGNHEQCVAKAERRG